MPFPPCAACQPMPIALGNSGQGIGSGNYFGVLAHSPRGASHAPARGGGLWEGPIEWTNKKGAFSLRFQLVPSYRREVPSIMVPSINESAKFIIW